MDFVEDAKIFIERAANAGHPEVVKEHLKMADWCLGQAIAAREGASVPKRDGAPIRPS